MINSFLGKLDTIEDTQQSSITDIHLTKWRNDMRTHKDQLKELVQERMINDPNTHAVVRTMAQMYVDDLQSSGSLVDILFSQHFYEFMLSLFKVHFKLYDDSLKRLIDNESRTPAAIIVTKEEFEMLKGGEHK